MATRTFSYTPNESGTISGTDRVGDITIGDPSLGYASFPGIKFWNGPEFQNSGMVHNLKFL
jgi:hypothetical protein